MAPKHIRAIIHIAKEIAGTYLIKDEYHRRILKHARALVDSGYGEAIFMMRKSTVESTCWKSGENTIKVFNQYIITKDGR